MAKKTAADIRSELPDGWYFDLKNYEGVTVTRPDNDPNSLTCHRVGGKPVIVRFEKRLSNWRCEVNVLVALEAKPEEFHRLHTGIEPTEAVIDFWERLQSNANSDWRHKAQKVWNEVAKMFPET